MAKSITILFVLITELLFLGSCQTTDYDKIPSAGREPVIEPDYAGVTIPPNIAPMNFILLEKGSNFNIKVTSTNGASFSFKSSDEIVQFPSKAWKNLLKGSLGGRIEIVIVSEDKEHKFIKYDPVRMNIANDSVDPYLCYRLLYPGYKYWAEMKIVERSTEDFNETSLFENQLLKDNCVNCHSFNKNNPDRFLLHVRGSLGGTYFVDGNKVSRAVLKTQNMPANAVYPSWHPSGSFVAFSSNKTVQTFHMRPEKNIEVFDLFSSMVIYDVNKNEMFSCPENDTVKYMETFPCWSPDGKYLYYCRTQQVKQSSEYSEVKYNLVRKSFDQGNRTFGNAEVVFNAGEINKSVSLPSISPDGRYLIFTLHDYGTFSIWHKEADLYLLDLQNGKVDRMDLNSSETESYHSWSSNSRWLVFSSKRGDGLTARPYFAYFGSSDNIGKPFVLPQKDPALYRRLAKTFNRPEFITGRINIGPRDFERASKKETINARWVENK